MSYYCNHRYVRIGVEITIHGIIIYIRALKAHILQVGVMVVNSILFSTGMVTDDNAVDGTYKVGRSLVLIDGMER